MKKLLVLAGLVLVAFLLVFGGPRIWSYFGQKCPDARWIQNDGSCKPPAAKSLPQTAALQSDSDEVRTRISKLERDKKELEVKLAECEQLCPKIPPCAPVAKVAPKPKPKPRLAPVSEWTICPSGGRVRKGETCPSPAPAARAAAPAPAPPAPATILPQASGQAPSASFGQAQPALASVIIWIKRPNGSGISGYTVSFVFKDKAGVKIAGNTPISDGRGQTYSAIPADACCIEVYLDTRLNPHQVRREVKLSNGQTVLESLGYRIVTCKGGVTGFAPGGLEDTFVVDIP